LPDIFGQRFIAFESLVWPMGATQLAFAAGLGFVILLIASGRGVVAFVNGLIWAFTYFTAATALATAYGVVGAAWGMATAAVAASASAIVVARRRASNLPPS